MPVLFPYKIILSYPTAKINYILFPILCYFTLSQIVLIYGKFLSVILFDNWPFSNTAYFFRFSEDKNTSLQAYYFSGMISVQR